LLKDRNLSERSKFLIKNGILFSGLHVTLQILYFDILSLTSFFRMDPL